MELIDQILGLHAASLSTGQMVARACLTFFAALAFIRVSGIRTLGTQTAFDYLTAVMLGAILGRGIVSAQQPFFPSLAAVLTLMLLHRLIAWLTFRNHTMGAIFKGEPISLIKDGKLIEENLKKNRVTREDIEDSLRLFMNSDEFNDMQSAYLERSGQISVVRSGKK